MSQHLFVATDHHLLRIHTSSGRVERTDGREVHPRAVRDMHPTCLASDGTGQVWCGTEGQGVIRWEGANGHWQASGLQGEHVTALAVGPAPSRTVWAGTEPSALWSSVDGGATWERADGLATLPSASEWSFPPKPDTHHVRWITCHPEDPARLWLAIEAGALVRTEDGGRSWRDRVPDGPRDTHELARHPERPQALHAAAGDGYFRSVDGGATWSRPRDGLEIGYFRSIAIDPGHPDVVVMSGASRPRSAYVANHSDGRLYRREADGPWKRVRHGWPDPPDTIAPLLVEGREPGELWAADERGLHGSTDGGVHWKLVAAFDPTPNHLRGLVVE